MDNDRVWFWIGVVALLALAAWTLVVFTGDNGEEPPTTVTPPTVGTTTESPTPQKAWEEFKVRQKCVATTNIASTTEVLVFVKEGATTTAGKRDVYDCSGFLVVYE